MAFQLFYTFISSSMSHTLESALDRCNESGVSSDIYRIAIDCQKYRNVDPRLMFGINITRRGQGQRDKMLRRQNALNLLAVSRSAIDDRQIQVVQRVRIHSHSPARKPSKTRSIVPVTRDEKRS